MAQNAFPDIKFLTELSGRCGQKGKKLILLHVKEKTIHPLKVYRPDQFFQNNFFTQHFVGLL